VNGYRCNRTLRLEAGQSVLPGSLLFAAGLLGNVLALGLLWQHHLKAKLQRGQGRPRASRLAPFHVLLMALVLTDLLGTCLLSPVVLAAYGQQRKLLQLDWRLCDYFAFSMSFFSLATMSCLGAMALERSLGMAAPYLYERLLSGRPLALLLGALAALYGLAAAFCALPLMGFGSYKDYQPGTWCFIHMRPEGRAGAFALLYASVVLLLFLAVLLGNLVVMVSLCRMYLRRAHTGLPGRARRPFSMSEELDHLILLSIMTIIFAVCSLPFTIHAFMNHFSKDYQEKDLLVAMRFLSVNSIVNPWAFVILRPPVLRLLRSIPCCQIPLKSQPNNRQMPVEQMDSWKTIQYLTY
uniref:Prostaglandin E receptor 2 n=1 Tax=Pseudonaja textilis TaxID=8673 RepID=A0A670XSE8_PSETE